MMLPPLRTVWLLLLPAAVVAAGGVARTLGSLELGMRSTAPVVEGGASATPLLRQLLIETVDYLDERFYRSLDSSFQKVSCSIVTYQTASVNAGKAAQYYTATVTLTGRAMFRADTAVTQEDVGALTAESFRDGEAQFLQLLQSNAQFPFLDNLLTATVTVNSKSNPLEDDNASYPPPTTSTEVEDKNNDSLEVWKIALIAGGAAFGAVLCLALTCICCMKVDDDDEDAIARQKQKNKLSVQTYTTGRVSTRKETGDDDLASKSPSEVRSITSQDSSIFTYNPRSVRTCMTADSRMTGYHTSGSTYFTNNTGGVEMDLAAWQSSSQLNPNISAAFGQDISAIEAASSVAHNRKDLSLIQEESSQTSTPAQTPKKKNGGSDHRAITESALNDLAAMERGMLGGGGGSGDDDSQEDEDSTIFVLQSGTSDTRGSARSSSGGEPQRPPMISLAGGHQHVMADLQELSHQIDAYRGGTQQQQPQPQPPPPASHYHGNDRR